MDSGRRQLAETMPPEKRKQLHKRHVRGALVRSIASVCMWTFALIAYWIDFFQAHHFIGISVSILYLIVISPLTLIVLKNLTRQRPYEIFSLFVNQLEVIGYTAIIYFCGGIEATYLTLLYAALITYVGVAAPPKHSFIVASICISTFSVMVGLVYFDFLPDIGVISGFSIGLSYQLLTLAVIIGLLIVVAFISATTANLLRKNRNELYHQNLAMEQAYKKLKQEIEERSRSEIERRELQFQLQRAQKMEAVGTLAGGVAHDINNILSGIVSYPDLLLMQIPENSELKEPILTIKKSGEKVAAIVQDLLTLARRGVAIAEVVNLNDLITEYLTSPEYEKLQLYHSNVRVTTQLDKDLLNISGSAVHLSKTVMNLISNATEAMPHGGTICVSTDNRFIDRPIKTCDLVEEGDYVILTISDTGVGISSNDIERIFEPFYTKKKLGRSGTGLGMAVVWGTVKDSKGFIDVKSVEGKGTTFTLYFPATRKSTFQTETSFSIEDYRGKGESILVVDDIKEQRQIASKILSELGYSVITVSSGEKAVEHMKYNSEDLLVLDMIMEPGIDGLDTYKQILTTHPEQKAIITSGYSETKQVKEAQKLGAGPYIRKPFTMEKIGLAVKSELAKQ